MADIRLRPWAEEDFLLLERTVGDPQMTRHLGGAESAEKMRERHARYLTMGDPDAGRMFVILAGGVAAGTHGYWRREEARAAVWETGWFVLPDFQGMGVATAATQLVAELAFADAPDRPIHAYPGVDNAASNAVCRKAGFRLIGGLTFEYPPGHRLRCNDWVLEPPG
ncbi:MAG TPA: GNAT family N-acetyltransferase [Candidatus Limnocylindria bacterium]